LQANSERKFTSLSSKAFRSNNTKREFKPLVNYSLFNTSSKGLDNNNENFEFQELKRELDESAAKKGVESQDAPQEKSEETSVTTSLKQAFKRDRDNEYNKSANEFDILNKIIRELEIEENDLPMKPKKRKDFDLKKAKKILDEYEAIDFQQEDRGCCKKCSIF